MEILDAWDPAPGVGGPIYQQLDGFALPASLPPRETEDLFLQSMSKRRLCS